MRDVVAHLVDGAQFCLWTISRGVQGDTSPPPELAQSGTIRAEVIAQHAIASRERLGDALLATFRTQYEQLYGLTDRTNKRHFIAAPSGAHP